jgi:hypothetical protein
MTGAGWKTKRHMKRILNKIYTGLTLLGVDPAAFVAFVKEFPAYWKDYRLFKKQMAGNAEFPFGVLYPILRDKTQESGIMKGHYFHQDMLVARKIYKRNPVRHIDVGSRVDGFVAHVAVFREIEVLDIRPQTSMVKNIIFRQADIMRVPEGDLKECCDSLSSLHAIEHMGLGRYGDPVDAQGHLKAIDTIWRMLKQGGRFYFSVPIGRQCVEFNARRVFSVGYLIKVLSDKFTVDAFHYVDDNGDLVEDAGLSDDSVAANFHCTRGCGIFELTKR